MKKLTYTLIVSLFAFLACQTDTINSEVEAFDKENLEWKNNFGTFNLIPEKSVKNLDAYLDRQLQTIAKGDPVRYGCVTFVNGYAIIDEGCSITSGVPRDYRDCDLKGVRYIQCGTWNANPNCVICAVAYILECDGELGWVLGYNIICDYSQPVPL